MDKKRVIIIGCLMVALILLAWKWWCERSVTKERVPMEVAAQITSIQDLQEWEFLCVEMEEMEDTVVQKFLSNDCFAVIYKGQAHLGIDMRQAPKNWASSFNDTLRLSLPDIQLLDEDIVNDLNTRTFYAKGDFSPTIKQELYERAKRDMRKRALMEANVEMARENARSHFSAMFRQLCGEKVVVKIEFVAL